MKVWHRRAIKKFIDVLDSGEALPVQCPLLIQVWRFGENLNLIALGGEPVVDYALRFKARYGWNDTWVAGYSNDLLAYIPSRRVLGEGGYEGTEAMIEFGWPSPFTPEVEEIIARNVDELMQGRQVS